MKKHLLNSLRPLHVLIAAGGFLLGLIALTASTAVGPGKKADESESVRKQVKKQEVNKEEPATLSKKWTVLHKPGGRSVKPRTLPRNSRLKVLSDLEFEGPRPDDPFLLGDFKADGSWGIASGTLQRITGKNAVVELGRVKDFELEGRINAAGRGGWFILLGWEKGHSYVVYNVTLEESGSPWILGEFRNSKALKTPHREIHRFAWKGVQPMRLAVIDKKLSIQVGREFVAKELSLENYGEGAVIIGSYDTKYGPKPVQIHSLRIRAR